MIGFENSATTPVRVSKEFHVFQAARFPFPPKNETVSQPVREWKNGKAVDLSSPNDLAISCAGIYLKDFPVPKAIYNSSKLRV